MDILPLYRRKSTCQWVFRQDISGPQPVLAVEPCAIQSIPIQSEMRQGMKSPICSSAPRSINDWLRPAIIAMPVRSIFN